MSEVIWKIEPEKSRIGFKVKHMLVSRVIGRFGRFTGTWKFDPENIDQSVIDAVIESASITTHDPVRDEHLISDEFLDAKKYPHVLFHASRIQPLGHDEWNVQGEMTLHGVTRPIQFKMRGTPLKGVFASVQLSRKEFDLTWNKMIEAGGVLVGDEISVDLSIQWVKEIQPSGSAWAPLG
jgi:polyisoprenoid-binding protein YceI